eukprot:3420771-Pyramimonas_sp.AAC.1
MEAHHTHWGARVHAVSEQMHTGAAHRVALLRRNERGPLVQPPESAAVTQMERPWCGEAFVRHGALRTHMARMHRQLVTIARRYAGFDGTYT